LLYHDRPFESGSGESATEWRRNPFTPAGFEVRSRVFRDRKEFEMRVTILVGLLLAIAATAAAEDEVLLKDGQKVTGTIVAENEQEIRIRVGDGEYILPRSLIAEVKREKQAEPPPPAEKPAGEDVIKLKGDGRQVTGKIVAIDETTITMKVGETTLGFDKDVVEWYSKDGVITRLDAEEPPAERPPRREAPRREASPALKEWIAVCVKHLASDDPGVQRSAAAALRGAGPAAREAIEAAAKSDDPALARAAQRLLEEGPRRERPGEGGGPRRGMADILAERLELTEEQKPKVAKIVEAWQAKQQELWRQARDGSLSREEVREKFQVLRDELTQELSGVLTEEQLATWKEIGRRGGRRGGGGGGGRGGIR
jgi:hypothetical protein